MTDLASDTSDPIPAPDLRWRLVVPVKGAPDAKSRLELDREAARLDLARAMALDTVEAALTSHAVEVVLVVTSDVPVASAAAAAGARVESDPGAGLNAAVCHGRDVLAAESDGPVAILLADLPAVRPDDLTDALRVCAQHRSAFVPDTEGSGTVLLSALHARDLLPDFGPGSATRHARIAWRLDLDLARLRRDVDLVSSLDAAVELGVGPRTAAALAARPRAAG